MVPSDLNLNIGKTKGYNNKILVSKTGMKIGSNRNINLPEPDKAEGVAHAASKMHLMKSMDKLVKDHLAVQHEQTDNPKMLAEKHIDDRLAITFLIMGAGLIAYYFW